MFGSKKDKEKKVKGETKDKEAPDYKGEKPDKEITIKYQDRRSSSKSAPDDDDLDGDQAIGREKETGEEMEAHDDREDKNAGIVDQLQRLQAEFDNYRKRIQRERLESWNVAKRDMVMALLPFMDDMVRVLDLDDQESDPSTLLEGMKLAANKFMMILKEEGLEPVEASGKPFDPNYHEALMTQEVDEPDKDNLVAEVLVEGYLYKGVLLRPARVKVLKYKGTGEENTETPVDEDGEESKQGDTGDGDSDD